MDGYGEESYPAKVSLTQRLGPSETHVGNSETIVGNPEICSYAKARDMQTSRNLKAEVLVAKIV